MSTALYRSRENRVIGGVCAGLARYLNIDVTIVRIFFVLLALVDGAGVPIYFILWLIMPEEEQVSQAALGDNVRTGAAEIHERAQAVGREVGATFSDPERRRSTSIVIGGALIALGVFLLIDMLEIPWLWWLDFDVLWPLLLVIGGGAILFRTLTGE
jgi:phage shock protein C